MEREDEELAEKEKRRLLERKVSEGRHQEGGLLERTGRELVRSCLQSLILNLPSAHAEGDPGSREGDDRDGGVSGTGRCGGAVQ